MVSEVQSITSWQGAWRSAGRCAAGAKSPTYALTQRQGEVD